MKKVLRACSSSKAPNGVLAPYIQFLSHELIWTGSKVGIPDGIAARKMLQVSLRPNSLTIGRVACCKFISSCDNVTIILHMPRSIDRQWKVLFWVSLDRQWLWILSYLPLWFTNWLIKFPQWVRRDDHRSQIQYSFRGSVDQLVARWAAKI